MLHLQSLDAWLLGKMPKSLIVYGSKIAMVKIGSKVGKSLRPSHSHERRFCQKLSKLNWGLTLLV